MKRAMADEPDAPEHDRPQFGFIPYRRKVLV
jgi:hypothetical protein